MGGLFETMKNAWKIPELKKKLLFTLFMLIVFRIGSVIPVPGITKGALDGIFGQGGSSFFDYLNLISGGALSNATIFALSITPYINSSIIIQLLTVAIPKLERLAKEGGDEGRRTISRITRYTAVGLALFQAFFISLNMKNNNALTDPVWLNFLIVIFALTSGTAFLMWLGEQITEKGVGNGISLLIFAGIISNIPRGIVTIYGTFFEGEAQIVSGIISTILLLIIFLLMIVLIIYVTQAERRIPVQYAKRVVGRKMYGGQSTHIPIKINSSGVMPVIFASSILQFPSIIVGFIAPDSTNGFATFIRNFSNTWVYPIVFALLVIAFTFFYQMVYFNPVEISNNIKKNGGFIPGIRPGRPTVDYIKDISKKITTVGAIFLAVITLFPSILQGILKLFGYNLQLWFGSTSLLILVGVALETIKQIESHMIMRNYKGFLE